MIAAILRLLRREDGVAMIAVMGGLLVVSLSAAALAGAASQTSDSANEDSNSKRALAAAEAGLHVATQRFEGFRTQLAANQCLAYDTNGVMGPVAQLANGECPPVVVNAQNSDVGDNASYSYVISPPVGTPSADDCRFSPDPGRVTQVSAADRCVTAIGTVNGVSRRVQARLGWRQGDPFFGSAGVVGLDGIVFNNSVPVTSDAGSNGTIRLNNSVQVTGNASVYPGTPTPDSQISIGTSASLTGTRTSRSEPWRLEINDFFEDAKQPYSATNPGGHRNDLLNGMNAWTGNAVNKHFYLDSRDPFVMPTVSTGPTVYYFCNINLNNSVNLTIPNGREVKIYVDSPTRPGNNCPAGDGRVIFNNSIRVNVPGGWNDPCTSPTRCGYASNLEFYIAGTGAMCTSPPGDCDLWVNNSAEVSALFYAPNSGVVLNNSIKLNGAVAGRRVTMNNSVVFNFPMDARNNAGPNRNTAWSGWFECRSQPTVSTDPESGC